MCLIRASKGGRAREVGGDAAVDDRAVYTNTQQKSSRAGQSKKAILYL